MKCSSLHSRPLKLHSTLYSTMELWSWIRHRTLVSATSTFNNNYWWNGQQWSTMVNNGQLETVTLPHWNAWKFVLLENQTLVLTEDARKFQRNRTNGRACLNVPKIIGFSVLCQVMAAPAYAQFSVQRTSSKLKSRSLASGLTVEHCSAVVSSSLLNSRALKSY